MGASCSKPEGEVQGRYVDTSNGQHSHAPGPTIVSLPPRKRAASQVTAQGQRKGGRRNSIRRVGSRMFRTSASSGAKRPASNYNHVQEAVLKNLNEAGASHRSRPVPFGVVGMKNLGNTCFMNSSLQCLSNTIPLTDYFLGYDYRTEINHDNVLGTGGKLVTAYAELIKQVWLGDTDVMNPSKFKQRLSTFAPQFDGNRQHDAQELLAFLLDGIHEDLNRVKKKPYIEDKDCDGTNDESDAKEAWMNYLRRNKSLVVDIFQGQFRNTCQCTRCGHRNIRFEPFMYLSLPISRKCRSLQDCLDLYLQQDLLKGSNQWYCEKCQRHVDATRKIDIWILPPILIVHLKRFKYDEFGRAGEKNDIALEYPLQRWDLSDHLVSRQGDVPGYDLYAIANHTGGLGGGHYTSHALNRFDDTWYEFNDSRYHAVDPHRLRKSSSAYMLFYNRSEAEGDRGKDTNGNGRNLLIRRQSISRPELWPHAQVRNADFREYARAPSTKNVLAPMDMDEEPPMQGRRGGGGQFLTKISERTDEGGEGGSSTTFSLQ